MALFRKPSWVKPVSLLMAAALATSVLVTGCGSSSSTSSSKTAASAADQAAAQRGYILIGFPTPITGPLGAFGEGTQWIADRVLADVNKDGGIFIKSLNKKLPVKVKIMDTQSDPTTAAQVATELITKDKVNIMLVEHTPDVVNPVDSVDERYQMPTVSLDDPVEAWLTGGPYKWSYHAFWTVDTVSDLYMNIWKPYAGQTNKVVGLLFPNDADGVSWSAIFNKKLPAAGYKVVDPGRFPDNTNDFTSVIAQFKKDHVQILTGTLPPPVFATVWRQMHEQGFAPKIATIGKALLFPADVGALGGNLPNGLTSEVWWTPKSPFKSSLTGETPADVCAAYEKESGKEWTATIGFDYAGFEIIADALTRAGSLEPATVRDAIGATNLNTIVGPIKYNDQHYAQTPVVGGQWVKGTTYPWELNIVNNDQYPQVPTTGKMIFPLSQ